MEKLRLNQFEWRTRKRDLKFKVAKARKARDEGEMELLGKRLAETEKECRIADLRYELYELTRKGDPFLAAKLQGELDEVLALHNTQQPSKVMEEARMGDAANAIAEDQSPQSRAMQDAIINSLGFPAMNDRRENIAEAYTKTFEWIFQSQSIESRPYSDFGEWLRSGDRIFWINGKAGSGKSTLMKFICHHPKTMQMLRRWSSQERVTTASFFFWNSGTTDQKSMTGLLRTICYDLLREAPDKVKSVFPQHWKGTDWKGLERQADSDIQTVNPNPPHKSGSPRKEYTLRIQWKLHELHDALTRLLLQLDHVCLFIDGLDEFEGDLEEMIGLFKSLASQRVKICLSSRPWVVFEEAFHHIPSLKLQDLTYNDIKLYVEQTLGRHPRMELLFLREPSKARVLVEEVINRAAGVFLWVRLAVKSLVSGLRNHDSIADLEMRLDLLPRDLEHLFTQILSRLDPFYLSSASQTFQISRRASHFEGGLCAVGLSFLEPQGHDKTSSVANTPFSCLSLEETAIVTERVKRLLQARCGGLLELAAVRDYNAGIPLAEEGNCKVQYLHRTVADFFEQREISEKLIQQAGSDFSPDRRLLACYVMRLRRCFHTPILSAKFALWANLVTQTMELAQIIERDTGVSETALVDELDRTISRQNGKPPHRDCSNFLAFATVHGLTEYLRSKLALEYTSPSSSKELPLYLYLALCRPWSRRPPHLGTVDLLLQLGADPNQSLEEATVWQKYLSLVADHESNADSGHLSIIEQLLRCGADPMAKCIDVSARGVVEPVSEVVRYAFPESDAKISLQKFIEETINTIWTRDVSDSKPSSSNLLSSGVKWARKTFVRRKE